MTAFSHISYDADFSKVLKQPETETFVAETEYWFGDATQNRISSW